MVLYEIIDYIQDCIDNDADLPDIEVLEAYKYAHKLNKTEIQAMIIDHTEFERFTTFEDGKVYVSPLQFNIYATQMEIGNEIVSAQKAAYILAQKIIDWLNVNDVHEAIEDVISVRNGTYVTSRPFDTGTILYQSIVRIDFYLQHN